MSMQNADDILRLIDQHRFHNPLAPRACYICKVEQYRSESTPAVRWSRAVRTAFHPPMPVAVMMFLIVALTLALALSLAA